MTELTEQLVDLHTAAIDAQEGYREALEDAAGGEMAPLFERMISMHGNHAAELRATLMELGLNPDEDGSFMSTVNRTVMNVRSLFGGLGPSVVPGLIDGETRNLARYDAAVTAEGQAEPIVSMLARHRMNLMREIEAMQALQSRT